MLHTSEQIEVPSKMRILVLNNSTAESLKKGKKRNKGKNLPLSNVLPKKTKKSERVQYYQTSIGIQSCWSQKGATDGVKKHYIIIILKAQYDSSSIVVSRRFFVTLLGKGPTTLSIHGTK